jgi:hypothetical protein
MIAAGMPSCVQLSTHNLLPRYSATYASRNGVPLEVESKVILRHQDLKTARDTWARSATQRLSAGWIFCMVNRAN